MQLLRADASAKLKLVNTGTRLLEKSELRGLSFPFRLTQVAERLQYVAVTSVTAT